MASYGVSGGSTIGGYYNKPTISNDTNDDIHGISLTNVKRSYNRSINDSGSGSRTIISSRSGNTMNNNNGYT